MDKSTSRRGFLQLLAATCLVPAAGTALAAYCPMPAARRTYRLSLNAYSFNELLRSGTVDLFDLLDFCAGHGFDALDPTGYYFPGYPQAPPDDFIREFKRKAFLLGLDLSGTGVRNDFANPDAEARSQDVQLIKNWIEAAAKLGIPHLRIFTGRNPHEGFSRDQVFEWMAADIRTCCEYGRQYGVMISLQNHNEFLKTAEDVNRMFALVDSPWLGLNLDIGSYRQHDPYLEVERTIHHAVTWQIKENVWADGREVPTDFERLLAIIRRSDYRGYLPLETLGPGDPYEKVPKLLGQVRAAMEG